MVDLSFLGKVNIALLLKLIQCTNFNWKSTTIKF